jgi:hypothetical protein
MKLYLVHGADRVGRIVQALVVLATDEEAARGVIAHQIKGFRVDDIKPVDDYPNMETRPAVVARITISSFT